MKVNRSKMSSAGQSYAIKVRKKNGTVGTQENRAKSGVLSFRWCDFLDAKLNS